MSAAPSPRAGAAGHTPGPWLIRYAYPGTTNGQPVGDVYVHRCDFMASDFPTDDVPHSHTYDRDEATKYATQEDAEREIARRWWPGAATVLYNIAPKSLQGGAK